MLFKERGKTTLVGERLRQLRSQLVQRLALAGLHVGEGPVVLGTDQILFARLLLDTRGDAALFGERLRQLQSRFGQRLARLLDVERRVLARTGQRLLQRVDGRPMVGGSAFAVDRVFFSESLEAPVFGGRGLQAPLEGLQFVALAGLEVGESPVDARR